MAASHGDRHMDLQGRCLQSLTTLLSVHTQEFVILNWPVHCSVCQAVALLAKVEFETGPFIFPAKLAISDIKRSRNCNLIEAQR